MSIFPCPKCHTNNAFEYRGSTEEYVCTVCGFRKPVKPYNKSSREDKNHKEKKDYYPQDQ